MNINKYKNGKIYGIKDEKNKLMYIGSSYQPLKIRLARHKTDYTGYMNNLMGDGTRKPRSYRSSFDVLIQDNPEMFLIKDFPCNSKKELRAEEMKILKYYENDTIYKITNKIKMSHL